MDAQRDSLCTQARRSWFTSWIRGLLCLILVWLVQPAQAAPPQDRAPRRTVQQIPATGQAAPARKVIVEASARQTLDALAASGATLLVDYGAFSLWEVKSEMAVLAARPNLAFSDDLDLIHLRGGQSINTRSGTDTASPAPQLRQPGSDARPRLWLVQFIGSIQDEWLAMLHKLGVEPVIYMPANAYVVWGEHSAQQALAQWLAQDKDAAQAAGLQWTGAYHPAYRLAPQLQAAALQTEGQAGQTLLDVTVQFYATSNVAASLERLQALGGVIHSPATPVLNFVNLSLQLPANRLAEVAQWPDVFNIEPYITPRRFDEVQGQIIAGNVVSISGNMVPSTTGYLDFLDAHGFPVTPTSYPIVDIVDDGLDQGDAANLLHPDFHEFGVLTNPDRVSFINNCTTDPTGNGVAGHGNINAGIFGSYNDRSGAPHQDSNGYRIGLGISPYGRLGSTKIFANAGNFSISACGGTFVGLVAASYNSGAAITSNSWGADVGGAYDSSAQLYDEMTRDASGAAGNQQLFHIFANGNDGPGANTVGSPATAKNVLSVGATENVRDPTTLDGCESSGDPDDDDADDMAEFSSRGPTDDGRIKPDIVAPGTHVQGPASQDPGYDGSGVCGANPFNKYYPLGGQTLYTWSSGTSHSTPAVAGAASLVYEYYGRVLQPGETPSPAMLKALLLNTPRYLNGAGSGGDLPTNDQGWGDVHLGAIFDGVPRGLVDQQVLFSQSGQEYVFSGMVADPAKPVHVSLVWTDAPGSTTGAAFVNNLDLEVILDGSTYRGNNFSGATSTPGGTFDTRNNVENVFVPAGADGPFTVRVIARNIAGDGLPGNQDATDQDFALVVYNYASVAAPTGELAGVVVDSLSGAPVAGAQVRVQSEDAAHSGAAPADSSGVYSLTVIAGSYAMTATASGYFAETLRDIAVTPGATTMQNIALTPLSAGRMDLSVEQEASQNPVLAGQVFSYTISVANAGPDEMTGAPVLLTKTFTNANAITIQDGTAASPYPSEIVVSGLPGVLNNASASLFDFSHEFPDDVDILLVGPQGQSVMLMSDAGGSTQVTDVDLTFSDAAANSLPNGGVLVSGSYRPTNHGGGDLLPGPAPAANADALSGFNATDPNGVWQLYVSDDGLIDSGDIAGWSLRLAAQATVAGQVTVTDTLPAGATFVSATGTGWDCAEAGGVVTCTRSDLAPGAAPEITITVVAPAETDVISNTVEARSTAFDPTLPNRATVSTTVIASSVDLQIEKNVAPANAVIGETITYTLVFTNQGPSTASGVVITDIVPAALADVAFTSSGAAIAATGQYVWQVADLAPGAGGEIVVTGVVSPGVEGPGSFLNEAVIASAQPDLNPDDNHSSVVTTHSDAPISGLALESSAALLGYPTTVTATVVNGSNVTYQWDFGDGESAVTPPGSVQTAAASAAVLHIYDEAGVYTLVVTATNSAGSASLSEQVTVDAATPEIILSKTVGVTPGVCAMATELVVAPATVVYYCFTVENSGNVPFATHTLDDSHLGVLLSGVAQPLSPGASHSLIRQTVANETVSSQATWTAQEVAPGSQVYTATASAATMVQVAPGGMQSFLIYLPVVDR